MMARWLIKPNSWGPGKRTKPTKQPGALLLQILPHAGKETQSQSNLLVNWISLGILLGIKIGTRDL